MNRRHLIFLVSATTIAATSLITFGTSIPTGATPATLYAAADASGSGNCADAADACTLATALDNVSAGATIELVTPGREGTPTTFYSGQFTVATSGTSAVSPVTIEPAAGVKNPILDGAKGGSVLTIDAGVYVSVARVTIQDGLTPPGQPGATGAPGAPGAPGGTGVNGGGIYNAGTLTLVTSTVSNNNTGSGGTGGNGGGGGGASLGGAGGGGGGGGGIYNAGTLTLVTSTVSNNNTGSGGTGGVGGNDVSPGTKGGAGGNGGNGGGIDNAGTLTLVTSTVSNNNTGSGGTGGVGGAAGGSGDGGQGGSGGDGGNGGGIYNDGALTVTSSTISEASTGAGGSGGNGGAGRMGGANGSPGPSGSGGTGLSLSSAAGATTVAGDIFTDPCQQGGIWTDDGYNAATDDSCLSSPLATHDVANAHVGTLLGELANNGGPTQTQLPGTGNPAIGNIPHGTSVSIDSNTVTLCPTTDQRGIASAPGRACISGSVQIRPAGTQATTSTTTLSATPNPAVAGQEVTYTATISPSSASGTVTFTDNDTVIGTCDGVPVNDGVATCDPSYPNLGVDAIGASYSGSSTYAPSNDELNEDIDLQAIYGQDPIGTAIAISAAQFPNPRSAKAVVLARSDFFSDALAGGPLAVAEDGPLLLTEGADQSASLDPRTLSEIERVLQPGGTVYILGGDAALAPGIDSTLSSLGYLVVREAGANEYATAVDIAEALGNPSTIFEATGLVYADALSAVPAAVENHGAILLTDGASQAPETESYLSAHPDDTRFAIGGSLAAAGADPGATAIYGQDADGTSAAVASHFFEGASLYGIATGLTYTDALAGAVFMTSGDRLGPILLVDPEASPSVPSPVAAYLSSLKKETPGYIFGGPLAVPEPVISAIQAIVG